MKQKIKRLTALVCAVAMMAALCLALRPVDTAYGASLNDQLAETRAKKQEIQQQLDQIKSDKAKALEQKELLDQQAAVIAQQIDLLELQIKDTQDRITENEAQEEQQYQPPGAAGGGAGRRFLLVRAVQGHGLCGPAEPHGFYQRDRGARSERH